MNATGRLPERVNIDSIIRILDLANSRGAIRGCLLCTRTLPPRDAHRRRFKGSLLCRQKNDTLTNAPQYYNIYSKGAFS